MNFTKLNNDSNSLLFCAPLDPAALYAQALQLASAHNLGACVSFAGIIRAEANEAGAAVAGLSFDICDELLAGWLAGWQARQHAALRLFFAHARGDVMAGECSYFAAICARKRAEANALLPEFVEDFKHHAPIWKYDLIEDLSASAGSAGSTDAAGAGGGGGGAAGAAGAGAASGAGGGGGGGAGAAGAGGAAGAAAAGKKYTRVYAAARSFTLPNAGLLAK